MLPSGHFSSNECSEACQPSFSFGYVSIQSVIGVFYKLMESLDTLLTTLEQHYLVATVMLVPASCLFSKGAFSNLLRFAHDLQYTKFDLEIIPATEHRGVFPTFSAQKAGDPDTLWELFDNWKDWKGTIPRFNNSFHTLCSAFDFTCRVKSKGIACLAPHAAICPRNDPIR